MHTGDLVLGSVMGNRPGIFSPKYQGWGMFLGHVSDWSSTVTFLAK